MGDTRIPSMDHRTMTGNWNDITRGPQPSYRRQSDNRLALVPSNDIELLPLIKIYTNHLKEYIFEVIHRL